MIQEDISICLLLDSKRTLQLNRANNIGLSHSSVDEEGSFGIGRQFGSSIEGGDSERILNWVLGGDERQDKCSFRC